MLHVLQALERAAVVTNKDKILNTFGLHLILFLFNALQLCGTISIALSMQEGHKINVWYVTPIPSIIIIIIISSSSSYL